jgi:FkbM family methyltransferase
MTGVLPVSDGEISAELMRKCIGRDDPVILEIGANDGTHTAWFKQVFPAAVVHCFEPNASAVQRFRQYAGKLPQVNLYEVAVGRTNGKVPFYPSVTRDGESGSSKWDASGSLRMPTGHLRVHPEISFAEPIYVPSIRLDDWFEDKQIEKVDFIWMDVQGAELDVFSGASNTISRTRYLYTEYAIEELYKGQPSLKEILAALPQFKPVIRYLNDVLLCNNRFTGHQ